ncbi:hypothetical protein IWQ57_005168 [Coemansia nantahalensis]|uniref:Uncharacterized protein n=2 Tax=Coemansia TaxID=4863 RepID=A0ACC1JPD6_9FUNG|nr:hypothetical protein IWQ57_005168 [Coemansia nantahalensis]
MPDHAPVVPPTSVFSRRNAPAAAAAPADSSRTDDGCSCAGSAPHNSGYEPSCEDNDDYHCCCCCCCCDAASDDGDDGDFAAAADDASLEASQRLAACLELPFSHCVFTPDNNEFLWSVTEAVEMRPPTVKAPPSDFEESGTKYCPPTPEIVGSLARVLHMFCRNDICLALVPHEKRHPPLTDFIWCVFDGTQADMWTAITCLVLLRRFRSLQPACDNAPYEAPYSLFLGIFLSAVIYCERTVAPERLQLANIARLLDSWYQKSDLVLIRHDTLAKLGFRSWIGKLDIIDHAKNNVYEIRHLSSSHEHYEQRERQRRQKEDIERQEQEEKQRKQADYQRYMYRSPHDTLCSWNHKIMYITEDRFHFRHLPWSPGANAPIHLTARSDEIREYLEDNRAPVFSPLLPALRSTVPSTTT